jgi:hypothetical protein
LGQGHEGLRNIRESFGRCWSRRVNRLLTEGGSGINPSADMG